MKILGSGMYLYPIRLKNLPAQLSSLKNGEFPFTEILGSGTVVSTTQLKNLPPP